MMLVSANVNAADVTADNLTVAKKATLKNGANVSGAGVEVAALKSGYLFSGKNSNAAYNTAFYVDNKGYMAGTGLLVSAQSADHSMCQHLNINWNTKQNSFLLSTNSYPGRYYNMTFEAGQFTFDKGNMVVNGKITCKDELNVTALNASTIKADDINVNLENAADYVFDENYNLKSLSEVESYVNENKHLPGMPSAAEMAEKGMSVSAMSNMLLEKVEELTLHMIRLEKENAALKAEVKELKK